MSRTDPMKDSLIEKLADAFADGRTFDGHFLIENRVSADDCWALEQRLAMILRGYLKAPSMLQVAILIAGSDESGKLGSTIFNTSFKLYASAQLNEILDRLNGVMPKDHS